jgi:hypothetical protein
MDMTSFKIETCKRARMTCRLQKPSIGMFNEKVEYTYGVYENISRSKENCLVRISK